jgi:hypothetical protein
MAMTYTVLTGAKATDGSICNWVNKDVPADSILTDAQAYIFRRLRVRQMLATTTGTVTASATSITIPTRYLQTERLRLIYPVRSDLRRRIPSELDDMQQFDGTGVILPDLPTDFTISGTEAVFQCAADRAYTYIWRHYQQPVDLSTATETNWLTDRAPRLIRSTCSGLAEEWNKNNDNRAYWLQIAENEMQVLKAEDDLDMAGLVLDRNLS